MAADAETPLTDTGWLPKPLRAASRTDSNERVARSAMEETAANASQNKLADEDEPVVHDNAASGQMMAAE